MPVGDGGDGVNVRDVAVGIAQRLQVNCLGVWPDCSLHLGQVVGVHKGGGDPELGQGVGQKVIAAAVNGLLGYDMLPRLGQSLDGVSDGRRAGGQHRQTGGRILDVEQALLKGLQLLHAAAAGADEAVLQPGVGLYLNALGLQGGGHLLRPRPDGVHHGGHGGLAVVGPEERRRPL